MSAREVATPAIGATREKVVIAIKQFKVQTFILPPEIFFTVRKEPDGT
jgi:hypothetical protein